MEIWETHRLQDSIQQIFLLRNEEPADIFCDPPNTDTYVCISQYTTSQIIETEKQKEVKKCIQHGEHKRWPASLGQRQSIKLNYYS